MLDREKIYQVFPEFQWIKDVSLREKCADTWIDAIQASGWDKKGFESMPVVVKGLSPRCPETNVMHTRSVAQIAAAMCDLLAESYPDIEPCDKDIVVAGALMHDVGKLFEYDYVDGKYCLAPDGERFNHPSVGAYIAQQHGLPKDVVHIILAHSDLMSPGGEKCYQTRASLMVKYADCMAFFYQLKYYGNA